MIRLFFIVEIILVNGLVHRARYGSLIRREYSVKASGKYVLYKKEELLSVGIHLLLNALLPSHVVSHVTHFRLQ